jgi:hypothetical protein
MTTSRGKPYRWLWSAPRSGLVSAALVLALFTGGPVPAADAPSGPDDGVVEPVGPQLPARVRGLLLEEMGALLGAAQQILDALVRGEDAVVAEQAQAMHDSFILAQQMTDADRQALLDAVPPAFVTRDRAFHELAASLAAAARAGDGARQRALFASMIDACADCHAAHATNLFPGFVE